MAALEVLTLDEATPQILAPQTGDHYSMPRKLAIAPEANDNALAVSGFSLTGANTESLIDLAGTWNTTGVARAIKLNITNTASGSGSKLIDLQVGGSSQFAVDANSGTGVTCVRLQASNRIDSANGYYAGAASLLHLGDLRFAASAAAWDVGMKRIAAAKMQITNGSSGIGELLFKVPQTDPAIAGVLWNNAGTLSISAG